MVQDLSIIEYTGKQHEVSGEKINARESPDKLRCYFAAPGLGLIHVHADG
jgi:hypothetical protein